MSAWDWQAPDQDDREAFARGYAQAIHDVNGSQTCYRFMVIFADLESAAHNAFDDPGWLDYITSDYQPPQIKVGPAARRTGQVYFAGSGGPLPAIKIGYTGNDPGQRVRNIATSSGLDVTLLLALPGDRAFERELHEKFAHHRRRGEWFDDCGEIRRYIESYQK